MSAGPSRLSSLSGILSQPAPPKPEAAPEADVIETEDVEEPRPSARPVPTVRAKRPRPQKLENAAEPSRVRLAFRLPPELKEALSARANKDRLAQADVIREALERAASNESFTATASDENESRLFSRPRRRSATASVPFDLAVTLSERDVIDGLAKKSGSRDRTDLITTALRQYLEAR